MNPVAEVIHQNPNPASLAEVLDYIRTLEQTLEQRNQEITRREQEIHRLEINIRDRVFGFGVSPEQ